MATYTCTVTWSRGDAPFEDGKYARRHRWTFDGGVVVPASASPHVVPVPLSDPAAVDPEEAFVASIASCHMLTFLWLACREGFVVEAYDDAPVGTMSPGPRGVPAVTEVVLRPEIRFGGDRRPTPEERARLHERAHDGCFIANSVTTKIRVESP